MSSSTNINGRVFSRANFHRVLAHYLIHILSYSEFELFFKKISFKMFNKSIEIDCLRWIKHCRSSFGNTTGQ